LEELKKMLAARYGSRFKGLTVTPDCKVVVYDL